MKVSVSVIVDCQPKKCILLTSFFNTPLSIVSFIFHRILSWEAFFSNDWLVWRPENWKLPMGEGRGTYGNSACNRLWSYNCFKVNYRWVAPSSQWSSWMSLFEFLTSSYFAPLWHFVISTQKNSWCLTQTLGNFRADFILYCEVSN